MKQNRVFVGIDPGKQGFLVLFSEEVGKHEFYTMPEKDEPTGKVLRGGKIQTEKVFNPNGFRDLILDINTRFKGSKMFFVIEDVLGREGWSAQTTFNFGHTAGMQLMIPIMLGATYVLVRPQKWQSIMYRGVEKVRKPSSTGKTMVHDTKATSALVAQKLYPEIDFRRNPESKRSTKIDDNKTDAFLMCEFARTHQFKDA